MNILGIIGWWMLKGLIAWAVFLLVAIVCMVWYAWDEERSNALDKAIDEIPDNSGKNTINKIVSISEIVIWPVGIIILTWWFIRVVIRAEEILGGEA